MILVISGLLDCETWSSVSYWPGENPYNRLWYSVTGETLLQSGHFPFLAPLSRSHHSFHHVGIHWSLH